MSTEGEKENVEEIKIPKDESTINEEKIDDGKVNDENSEKHYSD